MISQVIMVRVGVLDPELEWVRTAAFTNDAVSYILLKGQSRITPENVNYLLEIEIEDICIRRARIGLITSTSKGLSYEFLASAHDAIVDWFLGLRNQYLNCGDDWFVMAMTLGELYYSNEMTSLSARAFEQEQRRVLLNINPNFVITFNRLDELIDRNNEETGDDITEDVPLDSIWYSWDEDNDDEQSTI
jgi:hypothetical protein